MSKNQSINDRELLARISEGDEDAFNEFYLTLLPDLTGYVLKLVKSKDAVRDVMQEALIRFWLHRDKLDKVQDVNAWFFRIVSNECYRYLRRYGLQNFGQPDPNVDLPEGKLENKGFSQTEADVSFRELQQAIQAIVSGLSARQKSVFRMSREEGLTLPEIAQVLGVSRDYAKKTLMTALRIIRNKLIKEGLLLLILLL